MASLSMLLAREKSERASKNASASLLLLSRVEEAGGTARCG
jgi:hypothetical protein